MTSRTAMEPIFLFCSGMRSGSTLLQRIVISSGETMIWGETGGALDNLYAAWQGYIQMLSPGGQRFPNGLGGNGDSQRQTFIAATSSSRPHLWIPCINPDREELRRSFRLFFESYYAEHALQMGYPRWGFKKVRSDLATARFMRELFPSAKFIFLVREPVACLNSIKQHDWMDRPNDTYALAFYIEQWRRTAGSFAQADFGHTVRYEALITSADAQRELFNYLEITGVSADFFQQSRPKGKTDSSQSLTYIERLRVLLNTKKERAALGYP